MEPPIEQPPPDPKKLKRMKKKLDELNRKIRHSRKRHDGLIHKRNSLSLEAENRFLVEKSLQEEMNYIKKKLGTKA